MGYRTVAAAARADRPHRCGHLRGLQPRWPVAGPLSTIERYWPRGETVNYYEQRRERLDRRCADEGLDVLVVSNPVNVTYLTGFTGDSSVLLLTSKRALLVSDPRYTAQIAE